MRGLLDRDRDADLRPVGLKLRREVCPRDPAGCRTGWNEELEGDLVLAGLGQERLCFRDVGLEGSRVVVPGQTCGHDVLDLLGIPLEEVLHDAVVVDRHAQGLADIHVIERLHRRVHADIHKEQAVAGGGCHARLSLERRDLLRAEIPRDVGVALLERELLVRGLRHVLHQHTTERRLRTTVAGVRLEEHLGVFGPVIDDERSAAG